MIKMLTAVVLTIAFPAAALAQAAPAAMMGCCDKKGMADCHTTMAKMDHSMNDMKSGANPHAGHDMSQPVTKTPQADPQQNHQQ